MNKRGVSKDIFSNYSKLPVFRFFFKKKTDACNKYVVGNILAANFYAKHNTCINSLTTSDENS